MRILRLCIVAAAVMLLVAVGFAHAGIENAGTTAANFLTIGSGPRILSMGGATLGLGDDISAGAWNAAALGWATRTEYVLTHSGLENESIQEWAAVGGRFGESQTRWAVTGLYQGDGSFEGRDASNNPTGDFTVSSMALGAQVAHRFGRGLSVGLGAKSVMERLGDASGFGFTFDGGLMYRVGMIGAGLSMTNVGGQMKYGDAVYSFPASYGAGIGFTHPTLGLRVAVDANFPKAYYSDVRVGAEWVHHDMVAVRMGYRHEMSEQPDVLSGPTFGLGAGRNGLWFDYGYLISSQGESQHRIGIKFTPGGPEPMAATTVGGRTVERARAATGGAKPATTSTAKPSTPAKAVPPPVKPTSEPAKAPTPTAEAKAAPTAPTQAAAEPAKTTPATTKTTATSTAPKPAAAAATPAPVAALAPASQAPTTTPEPVKATPEPVKTPTPEPVKAAPAPVAQETPAVQEKPAVHEEKPAKPEKAEKRPTKVKVRSKESLADIARRWNTTPAAIMMENNLTSDRVKPGQTLKLPPEGR